MKEEQISFLTIFNIYSISIEYYYIQRELINITGRMKQIVREDNDKKDNVLFNVKFTLLPVLNCKNY